MRPLIRERSVTFWFVTLAVAVVSVLVVPIAFGVYGIQADSGLRAINDEQFAQIQAAREERAAASEERAALSAAIAKQKKEIDLANELLARAGQPGVGQRGPRGESAFPFSFVFEIGGARFTVQCYEHTPCSVDKEGLP